MEIRYLDTRFSLVTLNREISRPPVGETPSSPKSDRVIFPIPPPPSVSACFLRIVFRRLMHAILLFFEDGKMEERIS